MNAARPPYDSEERVEVHEHREDPYAYGRDQDVVSEESDHAETRMRQIFRVKEAIWLVVAVIEILIGLRVILKLLAANPDNPFASFIYRLSRIFVWPFFGIVEEPAADGSVLEISSLIAMVFYLLIGWVIAKVVELVMMPTEARHLRTIRRH